MASKVSSRQQAMAKARERRSALDQDRAARDRRVEEATAQVLLQLQERAAAEQAVQVANTEIGAALRRLLQDEGIAAHGVGALVDLTVGEVRRLTRAGPAAVGEGQVHATGAAAGGREPAVAWRRCRRGSSSPSALRFDEFVRAPHVHPPGTAASTRISVDDTRPATRSGEYAAAPSPEGPMRLLHLSDLHISRSPGADSDGVDARAVLAQLLHDCRRVTDIDLVLVSGDVADDGSPEAYADALDLVGSFARDRGAAQA